MCDANCDTATRQAHYRQVRACLLCAATALRVSWDQQHRTPSAGIHAGWLGGSPSTQTALAKRTRAPLPLVLLHAHTQAALHISSVMHAMLPTGAQPRAQLSCSGACIVVHSWLVLVLSYALPLLMLAASEQVQRSKVCREPLAGCSSACLHAATVAGAQKASGGALTHHSAMVLQFLESLASPQWRHERPHWSLLCPSVWWLRLHGLMVWALVLAPLSWQALEAAVLLAGG